MANTLGPTDVRIGYLDDGLDDRHPLQAATLTFDAKRGPELHIAYLLESDSDPAPHQFTKTAAWFEFGDGQLPKTLLFVDDQGFVTFCGTRECGSSFGLYPYGQVCAQTTIFGRPREIRDDYLVKELSSTIDGLEEFARFDPIHMEIEPIDDGRHRVLAEIRSWESVSWESGGFGYSIQSNASWNGRYGRRFEAKSAPALRTTSQTGATAHDHLVAQRPIRALLLLAHGTKLAWRSHRITDDQFPAWMMDGSDRGASPVEVHLAETIEQQQAPRPTPRSTTDPMMYLSDLGADGIRRWTELFAVESFRRAVEPAIEVINGASRFLEPQLMMLAISLDRFGYYRYGQQRRRAMHEHILKCLEEADLDWSSTIGSQVGIAKAITAVNNDLKHPDRESYPDLETLAGLVRLTKIIVRAQVFDLIGVEDELRKKFLGRSDAAAAVKSFTDYGIMIDDGGRFQLS